jgi:hypothetical protein
MKALKVLKYVGIGILAIGFCFLVIWGVQALWNSLIPNLFHGPVISYWQTAGLFLLSKILLAGIAPGSHSHNSGSEWRRQYHGRYRRDCKSEGQEPVAGATT